MNKSQFISELHDIGKLIDWDSPELKGKIKPSSPRHVLREFDLSQIGIKSISSPSWWAQYSDDVKSLISTKVPENYISDVLLTSMADEIAAAISRTFGKKGSVLEGIYVLWNPDFYKKEIKSGKNWSAFSNSDQLKEMFLFIEEAKNYEEFFEKYEQQLRLTAEDKSSPYNIVDLYTHLSLTGKIYRTLKKFSTYNSQMHKLIYCNNAIQQANEATGGRINEPNKKGKWIYRLLFCYVSFPQSLIRLRDLNILNIRSNLIETFSKDINWKDNILFYTDDFICLFLPIEGELSIQTILKPFLDLRLIINYTELEVELNLLTSSYERQYNIFHSTPSTRYLKLYEKRLNFPLPLELEPPLCESCQMAKGTLKVKDQIREYLCDNCWNIREQGEPASGFAEWEEKGLRSVWMKFTLDQHELLKTINRLFEEYVDKHESMRNVSNSDKEFIKEVFRPLAVQIDFVNDYKLFLNTFKEKIYQIKDNNDNFHFTRETFLYPIHNYNEFGIFKLYSGKTIFIVLDLFCTLLSEFFPKCLINSPIKFSLSISSVKFPYQEHWSLISSPVNTINIYIDGNKKLDISFAQYKLMYEKLIITNNKISNFIHKLTDIETKTKNDTLVLLEIFNNRKDFPSIMELIHNGLSVSQILSFYELINYEV